MTPIELIPEPPCTKCEGEKTQPRNGKLKPCDRCKGSGHEPPLTLAELEAAGQAVLFS